MGLVFQKFLLFTGTSESSIPESPEEHHFTHLKQQPHYEVHQRPNFMYGGGQFWNQHHHIYPVSQQYPLLQHPPQQMWPTQQQKVTFRSTSHHDIIEDNEYEVPFGHLMPKRPQGSSLSSMNLQQQHPHDHLQHPHDHLQHSHDHFNNPFIHQYMQQQQLQRSSSMRPQFYHVDT